MSSAGRLLSEARAWKTAAPGRFTALPGAKGPVTLDFNIHQGRRGKSALPKTGVEFIGQTKKNRKISGGRECEHVGR